LDQYLQEAPTSCIWNHAAGNGIHPIEKGNLVTQFSKIFNGATFQEYLELLLTHKSDGRCMHVILDNSRYHYALLLQPWLEKHDEEIQLDFLQPYWTSPNTILQKLYIIT
jgi:hypothetical protein